MQGHFFTEVLIQAAVLCIGSFNETDDEYQLNI